MAQPEPIETIQQLAEAVKQRGLTAPVIFTLEMCKPLTGCLRELYGVTESIQTVLFGREFLPALRQVLSSSERVEQLILLLEGMDAPGAGVST